VIGRRPTGLRRYSAGLRRWAAAAFAAMGLLAPALAQTPPAEFRPLRAEYEQFIGYMQRTHGFDPRELHLLFSKLQPNQNVIKAISAPSTAKPWFEFKPLFVDDARIVNGVRFWSDHGELLARAQQEFGVPESVIVSIVGIETRYGRFTGNIRVVDSLATLGFDVPGRQDYFRGELEQFLLLAREQRWDPGAVKGSFAGAMGMPQFMPSSYRRRAIDYDANGRVDLWTEPADIIGSVASYLRNAGWKGGLPVVLPARVDGVDAKPLLDLGLKPSLTLTDWSQRGVQSMTPADGTLLASLFSLDLLGGAELWFGLENFYALIQYNRSRNYAMAVYQLAQELERSRAVAAR
jgi:membrane-bound lytic murein transglycosylase B